MNQILLPPQKSLIIIEVVKFEYISKLIKREGINVSESDIRWLEGLFKTCKRTLQNKKNEKNTLIIEDTQRMEKVLPLLDEISKQHLKEMEPTIRQFLEEFQILFQEGKYKVVTKAFIQSIIAKLKELKEKEFEKSMNVVPFTSASLYGTFKEESKEVPPTLSISEVNSFSKSLQSLIVLSSYVESNMKKGEETIARKTKSEIFDEYGKNGVRFCNCYSVGYVDAYIKFLKKKNYSEGEIEKELWDLSKMPIFFVSNYTVRSDSKISDLIDEIILALNRNQQYIAIHGLGNAANLAEKISKFILNKKIDKNYPNWNRTDRSKFKKREFIYLWYNKEGQKLYEIFKLILI